MHRIRLTCGLVGSFAFACGCNGGATTDGGVPDAGAADMGTVDTGAPDAGTPDTGTPDQGTPDSGPADSGLADSAACTGWTMAPTVDPSIALPTVDAGTLNVVLHAFATGTQDYTCTDGSTADGGVPDGGAAYPWVFAGPSAMLADCTGTTIGMHMASAAGPGAPEWTDTDGSTAIAHKLAAHTVAATAIPWLLLAVTSTAGTGILTHAQYVQRVNTTGGLAPASGCDAAHVGTMQMVPYAADYYFFGM